jgi:thiosulfate dehydrogenase
MRVGFKIPGGLLVAALLATSLLAAQSQPAATALWTVPNIATLPDDEWGRTVRRGHDLIAQTAGLIGPEVANSQRRFAGNNLNCQSCHLGAGTQQYAMPLVGVLGDFPQYRGRSGKVDTIEDRINGCLMRSMNGRAMPPGDADMVAMVAYLRFLNMGRAVGAATPGRGLPRMPELLRSADPARGKAVYAATCAACHGLNGLGQRVGEIGDAKGYTFPPLWGPDSYNNGAGMARLITAANFIHANMPQGTTWDAPALTSEDAWDVAAFINSQPRPNMAGLERDYPSLHEKPVDAAYSPWPDHFSAQQHRLGPYGPIRSSGTTQQKTQP